MRLYKQRERCEIVERCWAGRTSRRLQLRLIREILLKQLDSFAIGLVRRSPRVFDNRLSTMAQDGDSLVHRELSIQPAIVHRFLEYRLGTIETLKAASSLRHDRVNRCGGRANLDAPMRQGRSRQSRGDTLEPSIDRCDTNGGGSRVWMLEIDW